MAQKYIKDNSNNEQYIISLKHTSISFNRFKCQVLFVRFKHNLIDSTSPYIYKIELEYNLPPMIGRGVLDNGNGMVGAGTSK